MGARGAALRLADLSLWIMYGSRTCRAALQSEAGESEAFVPHRRQWWKEMAIFPPALQSEFC